MKTMKLFGILGSNISYSLSPHIFNSIFRRESLPYYYYSFDIEPDRLRQFISSIKILNVSGINVTTPFKTKIMKYLDVLDKSAKSIGAANVVINDNGILKGYNYDYHGIRMTIEDRMKLRLNNKKIAVVGSGGSARAVLHYLKKVRPKEVHLYNRNIGHGNRLAREYGDSLAIESYHVSYLSQEMLRGEIYLVINATPIFTLHLVKKAPLATRIFDLSYRPGIDTYGNKRRCIDGKYMLAAQASKSMKRMCGITEPVNRIYKKIKKEHR